MPDRDTPTPGAEPDRSLPEEGELTDAELECVVGGLTRPWEEPPLTWNSVPRIP